MRRLGLVVLAWWFALTAGDATNRLIGPFDREEACHFMRRAVEKREQQTSQCWYYGSQEERIL